jgi:hypothetical protein
MNIYEQSSNSLSIFRFSWMNCRNVTNTAVPAFDKIVCLFYMIMNQDLFGEGGIYVETPS